MRIAGKAIDKGVSESEKPTDVSERLGQKGGYRSERRSESAELVQIPEVDRVANTLLKTST